MLFDQERFWQKYEIALALFLREMNISKDEAEEYISFAFERAYRKLIQGKLKNDSVFASYMVITAKRKYWKESKKRKRFAPDDQIPEHEVEPHIFQILEERENNRIHEKKMARVMEAIEKLRDTERRLLLKLLDNPDTTHREMSKHLGITYKASRVRKYRAIESVRNELRKTEPEAVVELPEHRDEFNSHKVRTELRELRQRFAKGRISIKALVYKQEKLEAKLDELLKKENTK